MTGWIHRAAELDCTGSVQLGGRFAPCGDFNMRFERGSVLNPSLKDAGFLLARGFRSQQYDAQKGEEQQARYRR